MPNPSSYKVLYTDYAGSWYKTVIHKEKRTVNFYVSLDSHSPFRKTTIDELDPELIVKIKHQRQTDTK